MNDADRLELPDVGPPGLEEQWDAIERPMPFGRPYVGHYDRSGNPISLRDYLRLSLYDERENGKYRRVKQDTIGDYWISTVWMGIDMGFHMDGPPLIFESMVFRNSTHESDLECLRYATEEEALKGHEALVTEVQLIAALED